MVAYAFHALARPGSGAGARLNDQIARSPLRAGASLSGDARSCGRLLPTTPVPTCGRPHLRWRPLRAGDLLVELGGTRVRGVSDVLELMEHEVIGAHLTAVVLRDGFERR